MHVWVQVCGIRTRHSVDVGPGASGFWFPWVKWAVLLRGDAFFTWVMSFAGGYSELEAQGCYEEWFEDRDLRHEVRMQALTPQKCITVCRDRGYSYAGVLVRSTFFLNTVDAFSICDAERDIKRKMETTEETTFSCGFHTVDTGFACQRKFKHKTLRFVFVSKVLKASWDSRPKPTIPSAFWPLAVSSLYAPF